MIIRLATDYCDLQVTYGVCDDAPVIETVHGGTSRDGDAALLAAFAALFHDDRFRSLVHVEHLRRKQLKAGRAAA
jgi:hypothetical protein